MDYRKSAQEVLDNIGGAGNVVSAAHCATRLRLVIADNARVDKEALENIDGAKGVFEAQGQLQIIFWYRHRQQGLRGVHRAQWRRGCHQGRGQGGRGAAAEHLYACH